MNQIRCRCIFYYHLAALIISSFVLYISSTSYSSEVVCFKRHQFLLKKNKNADVLVIIFPSAGWYLISLPIVVSDNSQTTLFPTADSILFWSGDQYIPSTTIDAGKGYWLRITEPSVACIEGTPLVALSEHYVPGWHLIGSVMDTLSISTINTTPDSSICLPFFHWAGERLNYQPTYVIEQSYGHWMAVLQECDLDVESTLKKSRHVVPKHSTSDSEWTIPLTVSVDDSTRDVIYLGTKENATDYLDYNIDLLNPPAAPGMFDAFFQINHVLFSNLTADFRADTSKHISWHLNVDLMNGKDAVLKWDTMEFPQNEDCTGSLYISQDGAGVVDMFEIDSLKFSGNQAFTISADLNPVVIKNKSENSKKFQLKQNYPNPFNTETQLCFELEKVSSGGLVSLSIYNISGQLIRVLVHDVVMPGYYEITWNGLCDSGERVSSGVYFYKLAANGLVSTKKMVLLY